MFIPFLLQINEAFASQYVYCIQELGLDPNKVNVNGGAIAFGHPLDESLFCFVVAQADWCVRWLRCTGARQIATGLNELQRRNGKVRWCVNDTAQVD
jgi:acetyl-CoA acyltransferase 1